MKIGITSPIFVKNAEHKKYLDLTTRSIVSAEHDIIWIPVENYVNPDMLPLSYVFDHEPDEIHIVKPEGQQSVAKAWNLGIKKAKELGCDYALVINHDIIFKSNAIDRLVAFAESRKCPNPTHNSFCEVCWEGSGTIDGSVMWTMAEYADVALLEEAPEDENFSEHPHFSCFMVKPSILDEIGEFDENFVPAYCEDGDYHARIALANKIAYIYGGARFYHFGSRTIKSDQEAWQSNTQTFPKNQEYFLRKWGHPPVGDVEKMREVYYKHPFNREDLGLDWWVRAYENNQSSS